MFSELLLRLSPDGFEHTLGCGTQLLAVVYYWKTNGGKKFHSPK